MGIDHLELSSEIIAALYPESLVMANSVSSDHLSAKRQAPASELSVPYHSMGGNRRSISFLTGYGESGFMPGKSIHFSGKFWRPANAAWKIFPWSIQQSSRSGWMY